MTLKKTSVTASVLLTLSIGAPLPAQEAGELKTLQQENTELRQRVDALERELADIKARLGPGTPAQPAPAALPAATLTEEQVAQLKKLADSKDKPVRSSLDLKLYGTIKLDASYDDSRVSAGNYARWVESEATRNDDDQFNMTANQTRLGMIVTGPDLKEARTSGRVEIDFYGSGTAENRPEPLLRLAYLQLDWPDHHFSLLAGQAADILSPLNPTTVNYTVGWWQGNIGYRRPQLRLTRSFPMDGDTEFKLEAGPTRTITGRKYLFTGPTDPDSGADAGFPTTQGRASLTFPVAEKRKATVGISGHWGREEQHKAPPKKGDHLCETWSANLDLRLPLSPHLLLQGEAYFGQNLDSYLGGIGQGFDATTGRCVRDRGGWAALTVEPHRRWQCNLGGGLDEVNEGDVANGSRSSNWFAFGNLFFSINPSVQLALEMSYLETSYKRQAGGDALREQIALICKF